MNQLKKRIITAIVALCTLVGLLPAGAMTQVSAAERMVNVALEGTASTTDGSYQEQVVSNLIDGDRATTWQTQGQ